jgi:hypothetical protein
MILTLKRLELSGSHGIGPDILVLLTIYGAVLYLCGLPKRRNRRYKSAWAAKTPPVTR